MEQIEMLWEFQQADMEADALENEIKRSPNRLALKKNREFLLEQQNLIKQLEEQVAEMLDRVDIITDATENVWPMVQGGKGLTEMLLGSEDL